MTCGVARGMWGGKVYLDWQRCSGNWWWVAMGCGVQGVFGVARGVWGGNVCGVARGV